VYKYKDSNTKIPKKSIFWLTEHFDFVRWREINKDSEAKDCMKVLFIGRIVKGQHTITFSRAGRAQNEAVSFSIIGKDEETTIDIECQTEGDRNDLVKSLCLLIYNRLLNF